MFALLMHVGLMLLYIIYTIKDAALFIEENETKI